MMHDRLVTQACVLALMGATACATSKPPGIPGEITRYEMDPIKIEAVKSGDGVALQAFDAQELFEQAGKASAAGKHAEASASYRRLLDEFPDSSLQKPSSFNLGMSYFDGGRFAEAALAFEEFIKRHGDSPDAKDALFLRGISLGKAGFWRPSEEVFVAVLARDDLSPDDRIEAMARRGFARMGQGDLGGAEQLLRTVFDYKQKLDARAEARLDTDYYLAFAQFQMAQITHKQTNAAQLRWPDAQMNRDLEEKARLLLLARRRYVDAVKYGNPDIASMAAFEIGSLFQQFYDEVMGVPAPDILAGAGHEEAREVYRDELRKKLRIVLEKSLRGHEHNIELFERLGVETEWVSKSRAAIDRLRRMLEPGGMEAHHEAAAGTPAPSVRGAGPPSAPPPASTTPAPPPILDDGPRDRGRQEPPTEPAVQRQIL